MLGAGMAGLLERRVFRACGTPGLNAMNAVADYFSGL